MFLARVGKRLIDASIRHFLWGFGLKRKGVVDFFMPGSEKMMKR
ncbi:MAG: hypothetical protein BSOLF_2069 [Candidatus Carbobacillus altaicus]|uniref:Uncharacterized protein n=1 Tax=Candidatus Carbonibacillus altaicus TaxID=2163959 RepID=A0A2R6Y3E6_9BACL|nr:MAG: hypothetical protein BSOLF_2069 [Candidatus Carbobacillus altaicus]